MKPPVGRRFCLLAGLGLAAAGAARAQTTTILRVEGAWARATAGLARNGAAYMTIYNDGPAADRLVAVASPVAGTAELHAHLKDGDVMRMRPVTAIEIAPGEPAVLQPGGLHVMLLDLKAPLKEGERVPVTLTFAKAGSLTVSIEIRRGAPAPAGGHGHSAPARPAH